MRKEFWTQDPFDTESKSTPAKKQQSGQRRWYSSVLRWLFQHRSLWPVVIPNLAFILMCIAPIFSSPVGMAIGSWEGVTEGLSDGYEDGEAAGLSAEDTTVRISNKMEDTGSLEVLLVDLKLSDIFTEGNPNNPTYAALFVLPGEGVFTVDLAQSKVTSQPESNGILIKIPSPEFSHYLDDSGIETLAAYPKGWRLFDGSTKKGYIGWLNSREQIDQRVQSELLGYDALMEHAKASARVQVERLAQAICGSEKAVEVRFFEEDGN